MSETVLIASACGQGGGGIFAVDEASRAQRIDRISSMGLACDGRRLARVMSCRAQDAPLAEVVIYDAGGVRQYLRIDDAAAVHDLAWDGDDLVLVSTWHNAVRWFDLTGRMLREVRYAGPTDNWHVNCVTRSGDEWYATMFGPVGSFGGSSPRRERAGRIVHLTTGEEIAGGLTAPHTPRRLDDMWLVCESAHGTLLAVDERTGDVVRRVGCGDWTRGIAWDDAFLYVGTSHRRTAHDSHGNAAIVVLDRATWTVVERIPVAARDIYDLLFVPRPLLDGVRRGFDVNPLRVSEFRQYRLLSELGVEQPRTLWPSGDPLPWSDFRCTIGCALPAVYTAGTVVEIPLRLTNRSRSFFTSAPPAPVYVSYKWTDPRTGAFLSEARAARSALPRTVFPGETVEMSVRVIVPAVAGTARLRVTAIQEGVSWFDDQDVASAAEAIVAIRPAEATVWEPTVTSWELTPGS